LIRYFALASCLGIFSDPASPARSTSRTNKLLASRKRETGIRFLGSCLKYVQFAAVEPQPPEFHPGNPKSALE
jgi:hypothetical protein